MKVLFGLYSNLSLISLARIMLDRINLHFYSFVRKKVLENTKHLQFGIFFSNVYDHYQMPIMLRMKGLLLTTNETKNQFINFLFDVHIL